MLRHTLHPDPFLINLVPVSPEDGYMSVCDTLGMTYFPEDSGPATPAETSTLGDLKALLKFWE
jgi:hypothetical protein